MKVRDAWFPMDDGTRAPIDRIEVHLGDEEARLPHARLRHLARNTFRGRAQLAPDVDPRRLNLLLEEELSHLPEALRKGVADMARELRSARDDGVEMPSITFRLLAKGGLIEEMDA